MIDHYIKLINKNCIILIEWRFPYTNKRHVSLAKRVYNQN